MSSIIECRLEPGVHDVLTEEAAARLVGNRSRVSVPSGTYTGVITSARLDEGALIFEVTVPDEASRNLAVLDGLSVSLPQSAG